MQLRAVVPARFLNQQLEGRFPGRFIPRYSMVMFHAEISYVDALDRGEKQQRILASLTCGKSSIEDVDFSHAEALLIDAGL